MVKLIFLEEIKFSKLQGIGGIHMSNETTKIPQATAKRLPLYYRFLTNLHLLGNKEYRPQNLVKLLKWILRLFGEIFLILVL